MSYKVRARYAVRKFAVARPQIGVLENFKISIHLVNKADFNAILKFLPASDKNLQDRIEIGIVHKMNADFEILKHADLRPNDREFADWRNGHGLYTTNGVVSAIIKRSNLGQPDPDLFLFAIPGYFAGYRPGYSKMGRKKHFFTWVILKAHTHNAAGRVLLGPCNSPAPPVQPDPRDPPYVNFNYFDKSNKGRDDDLDAVVCRY